MTLTKDNTKLIDLIAKNLTVEQIAEELGCNYSTLQKRIKQLNRRRTIETVQNEIIEKRKKLSEQQFWKEVDLLPYSTLNQRLRFDLVEMKGCRFVIGDPKTTWRWCGKKLHIIGKSNVYCQEHFKLVNSKLNYQLEKLETRLPKFLPLLGYRQQ